MSFVDFQSVNCLPAGPSTRSNNVSVDIKPVNAITWTAFEQAGRRHRSAIINVIRLQLATEWN